MNKLITTHNGGMPDYLDNFRWHEEAIIEVLAHIVKGMSNGAGAMRLYGASISMSGANYVVSEGAIFFQGEIFTVPAHTLPMLPTGESGTYFWKLEETYHPDGLLTFELEGLPPQDCYAIRVAKLSKTSEILDPGSYVAMNVPHFYDIYTPRNAFIGLQQSHASLIDGFTELREEVGAAYFYASFQNEGGVWIDMPWIRAFGALHSPEADIKMVNGGVYEINIVRQPGGSSFRLYKTSGIQLGLNINYELNPGVNIFHLNGYAGQHDVHLQGRYIDGDTVVIVRLISVDPNPSSGGDGGVIVGPE